ncbi:DNA-binding storekeeper protein-related transcriptional regulator [Quillaja saponaria]|uniref:DNA-binding storekeeper protein-related transcriptional regulator n=1 Tax=Quillaja saponaria TaxID=32244 RepID=A0AAD7VFB1_QUISA|nr:DNA-binding storekeeper protein-related transcriptional regulator [Quillaja saponaria]
MLSPLVSWILSSSSSSSSSSSDGGDEENYDNDDEYYTDDNDWDQNGENCNEFEASPLLSFAGNAIPVAVALSNASPAVTVAIPSADEPLNPTNNAGDNTFIIGSNKRRRINYRRQAPRLWTEHDEMELLKGFLDYAKQNRRTTIPVQNDAALFFVQIGTKLDVDFNKNQLVEKLRRLKRKYGLVLSKIKISKECSFKNPHEKAIFEISHNIWGNSEVGGPKPNKNISSIRVKIEELDGNGEEHNMTRLQKRPQNGVTPNGNNSVKSLIEETLKSCLSPLLKELLEETRESSVGGMGPGVLASSSMPLSLGEQSATNSGNGDVGDEEWRKLRISELEAYSQQLEVVQEQVKTALEKLRSMGG